MHERGQTRREMPSKPCWGCWVMSLCCFNPSHFLGPGGRQGHQGRGGETPAKVQGWLEHLLCKPVATWLKCVLNKRECVRVAVAVIHQHYCLTLHGGRFTAWAEGLTAREMNSLCWWRSACITCPYWLIKLSAELPNELCFQKPCTHKERDVAIQILYVWPK